MDKVISLSKSNNLNSLNTRLGIALVAILSLFPAQVLAQQNLSENYRIGTGDIISVTIFGEEDMSLESVKVASNGTVSFPLIGEVFVKGRTSLELEQELTKLLIDGFLKKPKVSVAIMEYRMFYINGEVQKPGAYKYIDRLTVQKAIALAGGMTVRASTGKISLIKENKPDETVNSVKLSTPISPGDIITIGESLF